MVLNEEQWIKELREKRIALLGMMIEMRKLLKRAGGNLNEISYGTPF